MAHHLLSPTTLHMPAAPRPMKMPPRFFLAALAGVLLGLLSPVAVVQAAPAAREVVQKDHDREIERVMGRLNGEDRSSDYVLYVVLPVLGLIGTMLVLRRFLLL